jgi:hypothetical protein
MCPSFHRSTHVRRAWVAEGLGDVSVRQPRSATSDAAIRSPDSERATVIAGAIGAIAGVMPAQRMMKQVACIAVALGALAVPTKAEAALFFLYDQPSAAPNDRVTVQARGTPKTFVQRQRAKPFQRPVRLYLVRKEAAAQVRSRFDPRLSFVGSFVFGRNGQGSLKFTVPPLDRGTYTIAYWCPGCAPYSGGRAFYVQDPEQVVERYRSQALLRVEATASCPVTTPNGSKPPRQPRTVRWHGNGMLWAAWLNPDGVYSVPRDQVGPDGSIGSKLYWATSPPGSAPAISGRRLDAPAPPLRMLAANMGSFSGAFDPSWATPVVFPTPGCWRVIARVNDVSLTYAVDVRVR